MTADSKLPKSSRRRRLPPRCARAATESCHKMHSDKAVEKVAADKCADCHHENVYEC